MKKIAILGVTGYIGRSLLREFFLEKKNYHLALFSREKEKIHAHIKEVPKKVEYSVHSFDEFEVGEYDVIINCTGISSNPHALKNPYEFFRVTDEVDSIIIKYLQHHKNALYINLSSGVIYGDSFGNSVTEKSDTVLPAGFFDGGGSYAIAKIHAEAKHRALPLLSIVDIRVFGFFGSLVDADSPFLMSEITKSIRDKKLFVTNKHDITRDYITARDLLAFVLLVIKKNKINDYFDIYSKKPISKFALIKALTKKYGLEYVITPQKTKAHTMTLKNSYFSTSKKATKILGYTPQYTSLEGIIAELQRLKLK